jgi:hypothetical protein
MPCSQLTLLNGKQHQRSVLLGNTEQNMVYIIITPWKPDLKVLLGLQNQTRSTWLKPSLKSKAGYQNVLTTFLNRLRGNVLTCSKIRHTENNSIFCRCTEFRNVTVGHKNCVFLRRAGRGYLSLTARKIRHSWPRNISLPSTQDPLRAQTGVDSIEHYLRYLRKKFWTTPKQRWIMPIHTSSQKRKFIP